MSIKETGMETKQVSPGAEAHMHTCACVYTCVCVCVCVCVLEAGLRQSSWLSFPSWDVWRNPEPLDDGSVPIN